MVATRDVRDWKSELADTLEALAEELPSEARCTEEALYGELVPCLLHLAVAALLERRARHLLPSDEQLVTLGVSRAWPELLGVAEQLDRELQDAPTEPWRALGAYRFSVGSVRRLLGWLRAVAAQAELDEDGGVRELGALHESLLGLRLEHLVSPARRLKKSRAWLRPARVLAWAPELRAKCLQRELGLSKHQVDAHDGALALASTPEEVETALSTLLDAREETRVAGRWVVQPSPNRRHSGAHYTPWPMCSELVERSLGPLVAALPSPRSRTVLELRVCDPAMGAGAFLVAATRYLADVLAQAWRAEASSDAGAPRSATPSRAEMADARHRVARSVLFGVDKNPLAAKLSRWTMRLFAFPDEASPECLRQNLREGDALTGGGVTLEEGSFDASTRPSAAQAGALDFRGRFPSVFSRDNPGFDAVIGNPPWIAYVGRAAQPLDPVLSAYYAATNPAFKRYRTLHGLFVYRSATLLRAGGRLGLVLPTSVADLDGYGATRAAHDQLCDVDARLPDWGDGAFAGVFQPSMALLSTRRQPGAAPRSSGIWELSGAELGQTQQGLLERLRRLPVFPRELFGERGFQTAREDQAYLLRALRPEPPFSVPLREGADIAEFRALPPQLFADGTKLGSRLRVPAEWQKVALLIRQTARFPIAAPADGWAFRNSIVAALAHPEWSAPLLLCFLNSSLARWFHYTLHRDARQGMPQLKIGHLRALPALPSKSPRAREALDELGRSLASRNAGVGVRERAELDALVADIFSLDGSERAAIATWASGHPPPTSRRADAARPAGLPTDGM